MSVGPMAMDEAFTAGREEVAGESIGEAARECGFPIADFGDLRFLVRRGGIPIVADGTVTDAVGASGPADEEDIEPARLGVAVVAGRSVEER